MSRLLLLALLAPLLAGCSVNALDKGQREVVSYYTLDAAPIAAAATDDRTLGIEALSSPPALDNVQLIRRLEKDGPVFQLYSEQHRWAGLPRALVADVVHEYFAAHFASVGGYPGTDARLVLRLRLVRFEEVRALESASGTAVVRLEATWTDRDGTRLGRTVADGEAPTSHGGETVHLEVARGLRTALIAALDKVRASAP